MSSTIRCAHCRAMCPATARFCIECGRTVVEAATGATKPLPRLACPACRTPNEPGGRFCARCGADLFAQPRVPTQPMPRPAPRVHPRVSVPPVTVRVPAQQHMHPQRSNVQPGTIILLAGLFLLLWTHNIWPGILLVVGVSLFMNKSSVGRTQEGLRQLLWLGGLALLFATGTFWPGIIVLFVISKVLD